MRSPRGSDWFCNWNKHHYYDSSIIYNNTFVIYDSNINTKNSIILCFIYNHKFGLSL